MSATKILIIPGSLRSGSRNARLAAVAAAEFARLDIEVTQISLGDFPLPIYDGESRMDLVLSSKGEKSFSTKGFSGDTVVCGVRYIPKSGYRKGRKDIDYLRGSKAMEIWFAKAEGVNVYAPVYVKIPTQYGTLTISAVRFGG